MRPTLKKVKQNNFNPVPVYEGNYCQTESLPAVPYHELEFYGPGDFIDGYSEVSAEAHAIAVQQNQLMHPTLTGSKHNFKKSRNKSPINSSRR